MGSNAYTLNINYLISMVEILDEYKDFEYKISQFFLEYPKYLEFIYCFNWNTSKKISVNKNVKKFYLDNKEVIDKINNVYNLGEFTYDLLRESDKFSSMSNINYYYNYLIKHKNNISIIKNVLLRIKELGIKEIVLDEEQVFENKEYEINTSLPYNTCVNYLDNIDIIPNYPKDKVVYKSVDSPYLIKVRVNITSLSNYDNGIFVNTLVFDSNRLPKNISREIVFDEIINKKKEHMDKCDKLCQTVDFEICLDELKKQYAKLSHIASNLSTCNKKEVIEILSSIKNGLTDLSELNIAIKEELVESEENITPQLITNEKNEYIRRLNNSKYDID